MTFPMLAEFTLRLACGLAALLLIAPPRLVPPAFFRTQCLVILALLVTAALDASRVGLRGPGLTAVIAGAGLAYLGAVAWGVGLPGVGLSAAGLIALACAGDLVAESRSAGPGRWAFDATSRFASAFLLGSTLSAMLLGHHYLTAPAMSIAPLKRFVRCMGVGLLVRALLAAAGFWVWRQSARSPAAVSPLFLTVRWGLGLLGPAAGAWMTWETVKIRSTQSATGILYIAMTLVLFGELTAMVLFQDSGVMF